MDVYVTSRCCQALVPKKGLQVAQVGIVSAYGRSALHEIALSDSEGGCFIALSAQLLDLACDITRWSLTLSATWCKPANWMGHMKISQRGGLHGPQ
jgi:hypothetical protein